MGKMKIDAGKKLDYIDTSIGAVIKPLVWAGSSKKDLKRLDKAIQQEMGFELFAVQEGKAPSDFKPMPSIGTGVYELRIHGKANLDWYTWPSSMKLSMCSTFSRSGLRRPRSAIY